MEESQGPHLVFPEKHLLTLILSLYLQRLHPLIKPALPYIALLHVLSSLATHQSHLLESSQQDPQV